MTAAEMIERLQKADPAAQVQCFNAEFMADLVAPELYRVADGSVVIHVPDWGEALL